MGKTNATKKTDLKNDIDELFSKAKKQIEKKSAPKTAPAPKVMQEKKKETKEPVKANKTVAEANLKKGNAYVDKGQKL